jgi:hypothetical protein
MATPEPEVPASWIGIEELPVHFANVFGVLPAPNAFFLLLGSMTPVAAEGDGPAYVPIRPIARVAIAPQAMPGLIQALEEAVRQRDTMEQSDNE